MILYHCFNPQIPVETHTCNNVAIAASSHS